MEWFATWFNSKYYHILYQHRDDSEAQLFIDKLLERYPARRDATMLDLACGKGRHSVYLSGKGHDVTGLDLSEQSIAHAQQSAHDKLHFYVHDMRRNFRSNYFDYIFNFFTSFGYFSRELDHKLTLDAIQHGLRDGGLFVMDFMNGHKAQQNLVRRETQHVQGIDFHIRRRVERGSIIKEIQFKDQGVEYSFQERVRAFSLSEMARMFRKSGLQIIAVYGNYHLESYHAAHSDRMIIVAQAKEALLSGVEWV